MANPKLKLGENAAGAFFVDSTCIDCDTCRQLAPASFRDHGGIFIGGIDFGAVENGKLQSMTGFFDFDAVQADELQIRKSAVRNAQENLEAARKIYEAFNHGNFTAILEIFSPSVEWIAAENDLTNAAAAFQKAILYRSVDTATADNNLGVITAIGGDWLEAKKQFETALATSGGNLPEAKRNLEICRAQNFSRSFVAKLEFVNRKNEEN